MKIMTMQIYSVPATVTDFWSPREKQRVDDDAPVKSRPCCYLAALRTLSVCVARTSPWSSWHSCPGLEHIYVSPLPPHMQNLALKTRSKRVLPSIPTNHIEARGPPHSHETPHHPRTGLVRRNNPDASGHVSFLSFAKVGACHACVNAFLFQIPPTCILDSSCYFPCMTTINSVILYQVL